MENIFAILVIVAITAGIICYLVKAKRKGENCIGCPYAKQCSGKCGGNMTNNSK